MLDLLLYMNTPIPTTRTTMKRVPKIAAAMMGVVSLIFIKKENLVNFGFF